MSNRRFNGFTLLEMLLAVIIFTVMSLAIYQTLMLVAKGSATVNNKFNIINSLQKAISILEYDISNVLTYPESLLTNASKVCFNMGPKLLESDGVGFYLLCNESISDDFPFYYQSKNVGYRLKNKSLERLSYVVSENSDKQQLNISKILNGVIAFRMRIYHQGTWLTIWNENVFPPQGIEMIIELEDIGIVRRVIIFK
ncbi:type II secretion system minor pseudopilin GspJ [Yersinia pekkanenii]|uniref:Type II secretion system protein J n=1 Tax=Yersinia pekkanenii TaxID=1288385 RepID=A0A0T9P9B6_9GAMM|nr:type II secretion system minor pseudopilin GspJ [Yersinia pekkanenii]CNH52104.1 general secretion pathway protein J [Yersinia pekkanenii]CRY67831.1 general secretion pathway protein J [Yersinia pekkanenii]